MQRQTHQHQHQHRHDGKMVGTIVCMEQPCQHHSPRRIPALSHESHSTLRHSPMGPQFTSSHSPVVRAQPSSLSCMSSVSCVSSSS
eukprot:6182435-Pleurochrysis_carterae.AAC.2